MKNIVIFGMDNTGKTTLGNNLKTLLNEVGNAKYVHSLGNVPIEKQMAFMESELSNNKAIDFKIFDRFPIIEERVYGNVLRGGSRYYGMGNYENEQLSKVDLFIYCDPGLDVIKNWQGREQMDGVIDNVDRLYNEYLVLKNELINNGYNVKTYDFNKDDYHDLMEFN